jgi:hypothetical protein
VHAFRLPEFIKVDLSALTSKSVLGLQALKLPNGVKAVVRGANKNPSLISIKLPEVAPASRCRRRRSCCSCQEGQEVILVPGTAAPGLPQKAHLRGPFFWAALQGRSPTDNHRHDQTVCRPGQSRPEYEDTRHNAGFWWIDALARELKVSWSPSAATGA